MTATPLRIGNASGFYGDRFAAVREMLTGGPLDVLTGDYLAELTMLILGRDRLKDPAAGYARTFLRQLEECLGLAPRARRQDRHQRRRPQPGRAGRRAYGELADRLGLPVRVAHVEGDDLPRRRRPGSAHRQRLPRRRSASPSACAAGADVVVTGRVTDASLVVGPAAAHFGWAPDDLRRARRRHRRRARPRVRRPGHRRQLRLLHASCPTPRRPGFPLAEIHADGSASSPSTPAPAARSTVGTVTAQLLYEIGGARYAGPGRDRPVRHGPARPGRARTGCGSSGVRGEAPPPTLKVGLNRLGGFRNEVAFVLTGLDIEAKAALVRDADRATRSPRRRPPR